MVESNVAAATEMALRLHARHRWCITGTPIQRKLDDLYGLLRFLKASPYDVLRWWTEVIRDPYEVWSSFWLSCLFVFKALKLIVHGISWPPYSSFTAELYGENMC